MSYGSERGGLRPATRGRSAELALLEEAVQGVASGGFDALFLEGEAGIGKTHLLDVALARTSALGWTVLAGRCEQLTQRWPFHAVADVLRSSELERGGDIARTILGLVRGEPAGAVVPSDAVGQQVTELLLDLLDAEAVARPVVLAVDDLHWADPLTVQVLSALLGRLHHHPVLVLGATRTGPRAPDLESLLDASSRRGGRVVSLGSLDETSVGDLAGDALGALPTDRLRDHVGAAAGNPLFVLELVRALAEDGAIAMSDGRADIAAATLPPSLRLVVMRRLAFLPEQTLEVLRLAAVLGSRFSLLLLARCARLSEPELLSRLDAAVRSGLVEDAGHGMRFRHDLVRSAVYDDLPVAFRQVLHGTVARALWDADAPVAEVFEHLSLGATAGDDDTLRWFEEVAEAAVAHSPHLAIRVLERSLEVARTDVARRQHLEVRLAEAVVSAGELGRGEALVRELLGRRRDATAALRLRWLLGWTLCQRGRFDAAVVELDQVAAETGEPVVRARAGGLAALCATFVARADAPERVRCAVDLADDVGDALAGAYAHTAQAEQARMLGHLRAGADAARRAGRLAERVWRDPSSPAVPAPAGHLVAAGELDEAEAVLHSGHWAETGTSAGMQPVRHMFLSVLHLHRGEWDQASSEAETTLAVAAEVGSAWGTEAARDVLCRIAVHRGDLAGAEQLAHELADADAVGGALAWALVLELRSDVAGLRSQLAEVRRHLTGSVEALATSPWDSGLLVRLHLSAGLGGIARDVAQVVEALAERADVAWTRALALDVRGLVDGDAGRLLAAAQGYRACRLAPATAASTEAAGACLLRSGHRAEGITALEEASAVYERLGAARDLARVQRTLREAGVRARRRPGGVAPPVVGSLTAAEGRVADLIRQGLTYREIAGALYISKRTVETHAAHIFQKLGVSGRRELERQPRPVGG